MPKIIHKNIVYKCSICGNEIILPSPEGFVTFPTIRKFSTSITCENCGKIVCKKCSVKKKKVFVCTICANPGQIDNSLNSMQRK